MLKNVFWLKNSYLSSLGVSHERKPLYEILNKFVNMFEHYQNTLDKHGWYRLCAIVYNYSYATNTILMLGGQWNFNESRATAILISREMEKAQFKILDTVGANNFNKIRVVIENGIAYLDVYYPLDSYNLVFYTIFNNTFIGYIPEQKPKYFNFEYVGTEDIEGQVVENIY